MYSEKAKKHADACRFCYMCRHLCPIELVTGKENNTPRAKGLQVSMMERGMKMDKGSAVTMYECLLCGACTADCVTGFDPLIFIREARTHAMLEELTPDFAQKVIDKLMETGNAYGAKESKVNYEGIAEEGETLVWLGNAARYAVPDVAEALFALLKKAGVAFAALKDEPASGCELGDMIGHVEDVRVQAKAAAAAIQKTGAQKVIVLDSHDAAFFLHECKDWGIDLPEIVTATAFVEGLINEGKIKITHQFEDPVTIHDPCNTIRGRGLADKLRDVVHFLCANVVEMTPNREHNFCCSAGGGIINCGPPFKSVRMEGNRVKADQLRNTGVHTVVAPCHNCHGGLEDIIKHYKLGMHTKFIGDLIYELMEKPEV